MNRVNLWLCTCLSNRPGDYRSLTVAAPIVRPHMFRLSLRPNRIWDTHQSRDRKGAVRIVRDYRSLTVAAPMAGREYE